MSVVVAVMLVAGIKIQAYSYPYDIIALANSMLTGIFSSGSGSSSWDYSASIKLITGIHW